MCMSVCLHVCLYMCSAYGDRKRLLDPLGLELQMDVFPGTVGRGAAYWLVPCGLLVLLSAFL